MTETEGMQGTALGLLVTLRVLVNGYAAAVCFTSSAPPGWAGISAARSEVTYL